MTAANDSTMLRALVAGALMVAIVTLMSVVMTTARAAGALAVGKCGAYGQAFDYPDADAARKTAMAQCQGPDCQVVTEFTRSCAALAVDIADPCTANGWGRSARLGRAQNGALKACYQGGGKDCVIRTFMCDAKG
jgi:hypothetical protein